MDTLSKKEERFLKEWEFQKSGSKTWFFILYTIVWTIIFHIMAYILGVFFSVIDNEIFDMVLGFIAIFLIGFLITLVMFYRNECRYLRLMQKARS